MNKSVTIPPQRFLGASWSTVRNCVLVLASTLVLFTEAGNGYAGLVPLGTSLTPPEPFFAENPGTTLANVVQVFSSGAFDGTLETLVVKRGAASITNGGLLPANGLDFYYQLTWTGGGSIKRLSLSGFGPPVDAGFDARSGPVISVPGDPLFGEFPGTQSPLLISNVAGNITFDFTDPPKPDVATIDHSLSSAFPVSKWLVLRTAATDYGAGAFAFVAGSPEATVPILGPIPEPSTIGFGLALVTMCVGGRMRSRRI